MAFTGNAAVVSDGLRRCQSESPRRRGWYIRLHPDRHQLRVPLYRLGLRDYADSCIRDQWSIGRRARVSTSIGTAQIQVQGRPT